MSAKTSLLVNSSDNENTSKSNKRKYGIGILLAGFAILLLVLVIIYSGSTSSDCFAWSDLNGNEVDYCPGDCIEQEGGDEETGLYCPENIDERPMLLYPFTVNKEAICNDGTAPGIHYSKSLSGPNENNWIFRFEGGANCYNIQSCKLRAFETNLINVVMTTQPTRPVIYQDPGSGVLSGDPKKNPYFHDYNRVHTHYCSSDSFMGDNPVMDEATGMYFRGYQLLMGTLQEMHENFGLGDADTIVINGYSAGGMGVLGLSEDIKAYLDEVAPNADVTYMCDGCWFIDNYPNWGEIACEGDLCDFGEAMESAWSLWEPVVPQSCLDQMPVNDSWKCLIPEYFSPTLTTIDQVAVIQNMYDYRNTDNKISIDSDDDPDDEWYIGMAQHIYDTVTAANPGSYFLSNCFHHDTTPEPYIYSLEVGDSTWIDYFDDYLKTGYRVQVADVFIDESGAIANSTNPTCPIDTATTKNPHVD